MTSASLFITACALAVAQSAMPSADYVLDIVSYLFTSPTQVTLGGIPPYSAGSDGTPSPLARTIKVTLLSLERDAFQWGDACVYEVLIENTGAVPLLLPWSPDAGLFPLSTSRTFPGYRDGAIGLEVRGQDSPRVLARLKLPSLFGADTVAGSVQTLAPGQKALIRVPGQWRASRAEIAEVMKHASAGLVRVAAIFDLFDELVQVRSVNEVSASISTDPAFPVGAAARGLSFRPPLLFDARHPQGTAGAAQ